MKCEDGKKTSRSSLFESMFGKLNVRMVKKTSRSSLFESIRWLREPASEERLFGLRVCKPWI